MNFLAHLLLSGDDPQHRIGNLLGDFVKGRARRQMPPGIQTGFDLHILIDRFTDSHEQVLRAMRRIDAPYRRYASILIDVFFDHFLSVRWDAFSPIPRHDFIDGIYHDFQTHQALIPERARPILDRMAEQNWLDCYASVDGITLTLSRMGRHRLRHPNPLAEAAEELPRLYDELLSDFDAFFPALTQCVDQRLRQLSDSNAFS